MRLFFVFFAVVLSSVITASTVSAQEGRLVDFLMEQAMDREPSTAGMVQAAREAAERWDTLLNANYHALKGQLPAEAAAALTASQRQWLTWRDAEVETLAGVYGAQEGTMWMPAMAHAEMALTQRRAKQLMHLRQLAGREPVVLDILGAPVEVGDFTTSAEIKVQFSWLLPDLAPTIDSAERLQYDVELVEGQASATFFFDFDAETGQLVAINVDAYHQEQNPTVAKLVEQLKASTGAEEISADHDSRVWYFGGWKYSHFDGGDGEDSTYGIEILLN